MPKETVQGVITKNGQGTSSSGNAFTWFSLRVGVSSTQRIIGMEPSGKPGPRCSGLENVHTGWVVKVTGTRKGDAFFASEVEDVDTTGGVAGDLIADNVEKVARPYGTMADAPGAKPGAWTDEGIVVVYRPGKRNDWLEIVIDGGDQVPVTLKKGVVDATCIGRKVKFTGKASGSGFRHGTEAQVLEDA